MPISKLSTTLILTTGLLAQSIQVTLEETRHQVTGTAAVTTLLDSLLVAGGNLGQRWVLKAVRAGDPVRARYQIQTLPRSVDSLHFIRPGGVIKAVRRQVFQPLLHTQAGVETQRTFEALRLSYSFLTPRTSLAYGRYSQDRLAAVVDFQPEFESSLAGFLGVRQSERGAWLLNGELEFHLENAWETAGVVELGWKRQDERSQWVRFLVEEPHPLGLGLGIRGEYSQDLWAGLYLQQSFSGALILRARGKWSLGVRTSTLRPTPEGQAVGIGALDDRTLTLGYTRDRRNDRWVPTAGGYATIHLESGLTEGYDGRQGLFKFELLTGRYWSLLPLWSLHLRAWARGTLVEAGGVHQGQQVRFGGVNTLRGYPEDLFQSDWVLIPTLEWAYSGGFQSRPFGFVELALQERIFPRPWALGLGLRQRRGNTVLEVLYGLGRGQRPGEGRLHLKVIGRI